jgi:hypothetical protein
MSPSLVSYVCPLLHIDDISFSQTFCFLMRLLSSAPNRVLLSPLSHTALEAGFFLASSNSSSVGC